MSLAGKGSIKGKIHSFESCGAVDGPGLRFVVFMQGCKYRCNYCHNPDTWNMENYSYLMSPEELLNRVLKNISFYRRGGITVSGGEPLLQSKFLNEFFLLCKEEQIHTALDTAGSVLNDDVKEMLNKVDLVLLDIKSVDCIQYRDITGKEKQPNTEFLEYLRKCSKLTWIRYVLVPGITDSPEYIKQLAEIIKSMPQVEKVEILPYHSLAVKKYNALGIKYPLDNVRQATEEDIYKAKIILKNNGIAMT